MLQMRFKVLRKCCANVLVFPSRSDGDSSALQESALVETQIDAGSADRVPLVREQLQNATSSGLLQAS